MEDTKFDRKKVIEEMRALKNKRIEEIKALNEEQGIDNTNIEEKVTIKYLGKMEFLNEQGELAEKDVFMSIEEINGQFQFRYYDENQNLLGIQRAIDEEIILSTNMLGKSLEEQQRIGKELENKDKEEAKTLEELEKEQEKDEPQQLPGLEKEGIQFTKEEVESLTGPTVSLRKQFVDGDIPLENKLDVEGEFIKFVDIYEAKKLHPELEIDELGQKFVPLVFSKNSSATVVPEEKMRFSTIKGSNSTERSISENNDGTRVLDQSIVTFEIPGTHNYISVGFNEQHTADPYYEIKFQTIDRDSNRMGGEELLQENVGTIEDPTAHNERRINTEGQLKYTKELVTEEQAAEYAKATGMFLNGRELDLDRAREELERLSVGGKSVNDIVQEARDEQLVPGPVDSRRT